MAFTSPFDLFFLSRITEMFQVVRGESRPSYLSTSTTEVRLRGASSPHPGVGSVAERNMNTTSYLRMDSNLGTQPKSSSDGFRTRARSPGSFPVST